MHLPLLYVFILENRQGQPCPRTDQRYSVSFLNINEMGTETTAYLQSREVSQVARREVMLQACPLPRVKTASREDSRNMTGLMAKRKKKHTKHSIMIEAGQVLNLLTSQGCGSWTGQDMACKEQGMPLPPVGAQHSHALSTWQRERREAMPCQINVLPLPHAGNWS